MGSASADKKIARRTFRGGVDSISASPGDCDGLQFLVQRFSGLPGNVPLCGAGLVQGEMVFASREECAENERCSKMNLESGKAHYYRVLWND